MSEQTAPDVQPQDTAPDTTEQSTPAVPDAVMSRLDELAAGLAKLAPQETAQPQGFNDLVSQPYDPFDGLDDNYSDEYAEEPQQAQQNELAQLNDFIAQAVQQQLTPLQQRLAQTQATYQADQLAQRYPELRQPETVQSLMTDMDSLVPSLVQSGMTPQAANQFLRHPAVVEKLYLAQRAAKAAAQETPADATSNVQLEGSAAQVEAQGEDDVMSRILNAGNKPGGFRWA